MSDLKKIQQQLSKPTRFSANQKVRLIKELRTISKDAVGTISNVFPHASCPYNVWFPRKVTRDMILVAAKEEELEAYE